MERAHACDGATSSAHTGARGREAWFYLWGERPRGETRGQTTICGCRSFVKNVTSIGQAILTPACGHADLVGEPRGALVRGRGRDRRVVRGRIRNWLVAGSG